MWKQPFHLPPFEVLSGVPSRFRQPNHSPNSGSRNLLQVYLCTLQNHSAQASSPVSAYPFARATSVSTCTHQSFWSHSSCCIGLPSTSLKQRMPRCSSSQPNCTVRSRIFLALARMSGRSRRLARSMMNHMASMAWPGLSCRPSKESQKVPSGSTFSRTMSCSLLQNTSSTSCRTVGTNLSTSSFPRIDSISIDRLHRIIGSEKFLRGRVPGKALLQLPFQSCCRRRMFAKVDFAIALYRYSFVTLCSAEKAITAKQSLKMLQGCTNGLPSRVTEKYQLPSPSLPCFSMNSAPFRAISSHSGRCSSRSYMKEKHQTCLPCSHMNLSVSYTLPLRSRQVKKPPCSESMLCFYQKGSTESLSSARQRSEQAFILASTSGLNSGFCIIIARATYPPGTLMIQRPEFGRLGESSGELAVSLLEFKNGRLLQELLQNKREADFCRRQNQELKLEIQQLKAKHRAQLCEAEWQGQDLALQLQDRDRDVAALHNQNLQLRQENASLTARLNAAEEQCKEIEKNAEQWRSKSQGLNAKVNQLQQLCRGYQIAARQVEQGLRQRIELLNQTIHKLKNQTLAKQERLVGQQTKYDLLLEERDGLRAELEEERNRVRLLQVEFDSTAGLLKEEAETAGEIVEELKRENRLLAEYRGSPCLPKCSYSLAFAVCVWGVREKRLRLSRQFGVSLQPEAVQWSRCSLADALKENQGERGVIKKQSRK